VTAPLEVHRHSGLGFALPVPAGWERVEDVDGCALVAAEPPRGDERLRANVVVTAEPVAADEPLEAWAERSLAALGKSLSRLRRLDLAAVRVDGRPARRALSHYEHGELGGVCLEQWLLLDGGLGYVVSCTTAALEYDDLCDLMEAVAGGLELPSGAR
jgi:hypothetical protein